MTKEARQFAAILKGWGPTLQRAISKANSNRWPSGAPGGKGGQYAPTNGGAAPFSTSNAGFKPKQMSLFSFKEAATPAPKAPQYTAGKPSQSDYGAFGAPMGSWGSWGAPAAPKAPPPGAKPHPELDDKGKPVTINYPSKPSDPSTWKNPDATATFTPGSPVPAVLNGVPMKPWADAPKFLHEWANVEGQKPELDQHFPMTASAQGKSIGAGVIIEEPDGRIWLTKPTNHFGGYKQTFPKGTVEHGLSLQASAIKEAFEETGLKVEITGIAGDYERTTSVARFYLAKRVGGSPAKMGWESQAIRLAAPRDLGKLLNMPVDQDILRDYRHDEFTKAAPLSIIRHYAVIDEAVARRGLEWLYKAGKSDMLHGKAGHWQHQERWPAGSPLGGQWKAMGADGLTLPPTIAGGLEGQNPAYQKKTNALHAHAQANDLKSVLDKAVEFEKKAQADKAAGKKTSHAKWNAQVAQYASQLVADMTSKVKAEASADKITGPEKLSSFTKVGEKPGGSNDGAVYADKDGTKWLVKGNNYASTGGLEMSDNRAKNEVLAAHLMAAAGIPGPEIKLVDLEGKHQGNLGVAVKWIDGLQKFNPNDAGQLAAVQSQFAVHAWLGNWDVLGLSLDNTMFKDGKAINIDPGGSILFRAQGSPKMKEAFGPGAGDWDTMRGSNAHQKSVYGKMSASQLQESAKQLAGVSDDTINKLVDVYGPGDLKAKVELAKTLRERRDNIMLKAGLTVNMKMGPSLAQAEPVAPPAPPKIEEATPAPAGTALPVKKPVFVAGANSNDYYNGLVEDATKLHAAGDLAGLKAMKNPKKVQTWGGTSANSKLFLDYYNPLVADLEAKQAAQVDKVAAGQATVADAKGQEWKATDGVLNPVAPPKKPTARGLTDGQIADAAAAAYKFSPAMASASVADGKKSGTSAFHQMIQAASKGDYDALLNINAPHATADQFKSNLLNALKVQNAAPAAAPPPQKPSGVALSRGAALAIIQDELPSYTTHDKAKSSTSSVGVMYAAALKGDLDTIKALNDADMGAVLAEMKQKFISEMTPAAAPAPEPAPAPAPAAAPAPALPNFEKEKLGPENQNANSHNSKIDQIAALAKAGDVKEILALNYSTNTYGKKQAKLANDALAALGSIHKVTPGQKANTHPALVNGTAQQAAPAAAPAAPTAQVYQTAQNDPLADHSWAKLSSGQRVVEAGEQFGVKWVKISNPAKGFSPSDIPPPPDFYKNGSQGATGTWKSGKAEVNDANNAAVKQIYDAAVASKGDIAQLDALKFDIVGVGQVSISGHKAAAVKEYFDQVKSELEAQTKVTFETKQSGSFTAGYSNAAASMAAMHAKKDYSQFKSHAEKAADYLVLSKDAASNLPVPTQGQFKETSTSAPELKPFLEASKAAYSKLPAAQRDAFKAYTGSSYDAWNEALRKGTIDAYAGAKSMLDGFAKAAQDIPEGTIIWRGIGVGKSVYESAVGSVIQDGSFQSSSYGSHPGGPGYGKQTWLRIHVPKGVKAIDATNFSHYGGQEREIIIQNNVRYAVLKVEQHENFTDSKGAKHGKKTIVDVIALPH